MKISKKWFYLFFFFILNASPCLVEGGFNGVPKETIGSIVEFLDQKSWITLLRVNKKLNKITLECITSFQIEEVFGNGVIEKLKFIFLKDKFENLKYIDLKVLDLSMSKITDDNLTDLANFIRLYFPNIETLNLRWNQIENKSLAHLAALSRLKNLDLSENRISDEGIVPLLGMTHLETLNLAYNNITDLSVANILDMPQLKTLNIRWNKLSLKASENLFKNKSKSLVKVDF